MQKKNSFNKLQKGRKKNEILVSFYFILCRLRSLHNFHSIIIRAKWCARKGIIEGKRAQHSTAQLSAVVDETQKIMQKKWRNFLL